MASGNWPPLISGAVQIGPGAMELIRMPLGQAALPALGKGLDGGLGRGVIWKVGAGIVRLDRCCRDD